MLELAILIHRKIVFAQVLNWLAIAVGDRYVYHNDAGG